MGLMSVWEIFGCKFRTRDEIEMIKFVFKGSKISRVKDKVTTWPNWPLQQIWCN